ncbi:hypothetical protein RclHR1_00750047 [Rhizophagus clarus]|nr:hypothetical protein RclHR1_00750047 [Rhizophagus clarus]
MVLAAIVDIKVDDKDDKSCGKRVLGYRCTSTESMTVERCIDNCREGNYKYAGLEARTQCFCGNSYDGGVGRLLGSEYYSASCPGNNFQICEGIWVLSIYEVSTFPTPVPSNPKELPLKIGLGVDIPVLAIVIAVIIVKKL